MTSTLSSPIMQKNQVQSSLGFSPFGMIMPKREFSAGYRYGFNGMEKDDEIKGSGNSYTAEYWQYDSRIGRRWNQDPKPNPSISNYACFANNPIWFSDVEGDTIKNAATPGTKAFIRIERALKVLEKHNTELFNELHNSTIVHNVNEKRLNPAAAYSPEYSGTMTAGLTEISLSFPLSLTDQGAPDFSCNDDNGNQLCISDNEANDMITIVDGKVNVWVDPEIRTDKKSYAKTLAHELFGHAAHDSKNKSETLRWIKKFPGGTGHDQGNPSGIAADKAGNAMEKNYGKANKAVKQDQKDAKKQKK